MRRLHFHLAFTDLIVEVSFDDHWVSNHNIMTKYPDTWHILTDTTAQVDKRAEASNHGGPLAITKLDMQQKSMITLVIRKGFNGSACPAAAWRR